jgi:hypothetical protein
MHVTLRHRQVLMPHQFLNGPPRCAVHHQMRAERVTQDVNSSRHVCPPRGSSHSAPRGLPRKGPPVVLAQHTSTAQMTIVLERAGEAARQCDIANHVVLDVESP